ncbi:MAG: carbon-nitrogen hydrolase family protein [Planctomycetales bacterium]|nr:carbon-nitrogen hydrolase family protein [Planctomycetales bacterium]
MKIAGVQCNVRFKEVSANVTAIQETLRETSQQGTQLTVFPECSVTGYCFNSKEEAFEVAQRIPGPATERIAETCNETNQHAIVGMVERDGEELYNAAVLIGPDGVVASYRKVHLPFLGLDRFASPGNRAFDVAVADETKVAMLICYDASFPEAARCVSLLGADLITLPTNWPPGSECAAASAIACRALENGVYFIAVNRVGEERGFRFIGRSQICDPSGRIMHMASESEEEIFYAEIDLERARRKHIIRVPGQHEIHRFADRRPEMYGALTKPHGLAKPGRSNN